MKERRRGRYEMSKDASSLSPPRTSRARVWQKEWEPMPWDNKRRTAQTETTEETFRMQEERLRNKREAKMRRYRDYQVYYYGSPSQKKSQNVRKLQTKFKLTQTCILISGMKLEAI